MAVLNEPCVLFTFNNSKKIAQFEVRQTFETFLELQSPIYLLI